MFKKNALLLSLALFSVHPLFFETFGFVSLACFVSSLCLSWLFSLIVFYVFLLYVLQFLAQLLCSALHALPRPGWTNKCTNPVCYTSDLYVLLNLIKSHSVEKQSCHIGEMEMQDSYAKSHWHYLAAFQSKACTANFTASRPLQFQVWFWEHAMPNKFESLVSASNTNKPFASLPSANVPSCLPSSFVSPVSNSKK